MAVHKRPTLERLHAEKTVDDSGYEDVVLRVLDERDHLRDRVSVLEAELRAADRELEEIRRRGA